MNMCRAFCSGLADIRLFMCVGFLYKLIVKVKCVPCQGHKLNDIKDRYLTADWANWMMSELSMPIHS